MGLSGPPDSPSFCTLLTPCQTVLQGAVRDQNCGASRGPWEPGWDISPIINPQRFPGLSMQSFLIRSSGAHGGTWFLLPPSCHKNVDWPLKRGPRQRHHRTQHFPTITPLQLKTFIKVLLIFNINKALHWRLINCDREKSEGTIQMWKLPAFKSENL